MKITHELASALSSQLRKALLDLLLLGIPIRTTSLGYTVRRRRQAQLCGSDHHAFVLFDKCQVENLVALPRTLPPHAIRSLLFSWSVSHSHVELTHVRRAVT